MQRSKNLRGVFFFIATIFGATQNLGVKVEIWLQNNATEIMVQVGFLVPTLVCLFILDEV